MATAESNTVIAKSKPAQKKEKGKTLDEQIEDVYDELHSGESEAPPEGFIGKHLKKIRDKELAEQAAKLEQDQKEKAMAKNAYLAATAASSAADT